MLKALKILLINVGVFLVLLALVNWACGVYVGNGEAGQRGRDLLPNFEKDREHARQVFSDYHKIQHRYEPFVGWRSMPFEGQTTTISQEGQRTHANHVATISSGEKKIVRFFGGSTMWGEGSDDGNTIPALVNKAFPMYEVHNHGQLAYNTRQELDALITAYSKEKKSDIVIFYDGVNDAAFLCPKEITELPAHRLVPTFRDRVYQRKSAMVKELAGNVFYANILKAVHKYTYKPTPENSPYDCISKPGKAEEIAEIMIKNWEMAHEIVVNRGGKFIAILQPAAFVGSPRTDHLTLDEDLGKNFAEVYKHLRKKIAERNHSWIYDMSNKFDGNEYIFIDWCHVSPNGNKIIANEVTQILRETN